MTKPPDLRSDSPPPRLNVPTVDSVRSLPLFEGLSDAEIKAVIDAGTFVSVPAGWSLIWEQTPADKAYLLLAGEVSIQHDGQEFARAGAGELIGETAIVTHHLRNATVVAFTDIEALHLTRESVESLAARTPRSRPSSRTPRPPRRRGVVRLPLGVLVLDRRHRRAADIAVHPWALGVVLLGVDRATYEGG